MSPDRLARARASIRADGVALEAGEFLEEVRCVAAPVRDHEGLIVASIGISAPTIRFPRKRFAIGSRQVSEIATAVSASLAG